MSKPLAIVLLAGMGSRLGRPYPKSFTSLENGETILQRQARMLSEAGLSATAVVGFKKDLIMEAAPDFLFAYNPIYDTTNTAKSLLCALKHVVDIDVLWLNGDVVFEKRVLQKILNAEGSVAAVNREICGEEEVKYKVNEKGFITEISKSISNAQGEAVGINLIRKEHLPAFKKKLEEVADNDYFEKAMELLIKEQGDVFKPLDISELRCIEVDFQADLDKARELFSN